MARHRTATQRRTLLDRILRRRKSVQLADDFVRADPGTQLLPDLNWQTPDEWARQHSGPANGADDARLSEGGAR